MLSSPLLWWGGWKSFVVSSYSVFISTWCCWQCRSPKRSKTINKTIPRCCPCLCASQVYRCPSFQKFLASWQSAIKLSLPRYLSDFFFLSKICSALTRGRRSHICFFISFVNTLHGFYKFGDILIFLNVTSCHVVAGKMIESLTFGSLLFRNETTLTPWDVYF